MLEFLHFCLIQGIFVCTWGKLAFQNNILRRTRSSNSPNSWCSMTKKHKMVNSEIFNLNLLFLRNHFSIVSKLLLQSQVQ